MSGQVDGKKRGILRHILSYWPQYANGIGGVGVAITSVMLDTTITGWQALNPTPNRWFAFFAALNIVGIISSTIQAPNIKDLEDENGVLKERLEGILTQTQFDIYKIFDNEARRLFVEMGLDDANKNTNRVSIYIYDQLAQRFIRIGRYSSNPDYKSSGRRSYEYGVGCIYKAWCNGEDFDDGVPNSGPNPDNWNEYVTYHANQWGIDQYTVEAFSMLSRSYGAFAVPELPNGERLAVVVFESTRPKAFPKRRLQQKIEGDDGRQLAQLLETFMFLIPHLSLAVQEEF